MLSQRSRYALKALLYLADVGEGWSAISTISEATSISRKFLEGILLELKRYRLVDSVRGKFGGYRLARPATEITFGDVIRATDGPIALVPCASKNFYRPCDDCLDETTCALHKVMARTRAKMGEVLDSTSLAEIAADRESLKGAGLRL